MAGNQMYNFDIYVSYQIVDLELKEMNFWEFRRRYYRFVDIYKMHEGIPPKLFPVYDLPFKAKMCSEMKRCITKWSISKYFSFSTFPIFFLCMCMYEQERWFLFRYETIFSDVVAHGRTVSIFSTCVDIFTCSYVRACVRV